MPLVQYYHLRQHTLASNHGNLRMKTANLTVTYGGYYGNKYGNIVTILTKQVSRQEA